MRIIGNAEKAREVQAVASGALSTGDTVIVNSDGTVSVISSTIGTASLFQETNSSYIGSDFDSNSNKVVVAYQAGGAGKCVVGTVSGTSISFGTPVTFASVDTYYNSVVFDPSNNKVVVVYAGASFYGTAVVGTVSGTSISFGSPTIFKSTTSEYLSSTLDSNLNKVVVAWKDSGNSGTGTAIVGTVSGTSISFGSTAVYNSGNTDWVSSTFDSNSNKVVIAYRDIGNSLHGTAIVGTVSGTSISFGSEVVFNSAQVRHTSSTFDSNSNKVVISYRDEGNSSYGTAIVGTVSGTSISFGSSVVFESAALEYIGSAFDSSSNTVFLAYNDVGNSDSGTAIVGTVSGTSIGFGTPFVFESGDTRYINSVYDSNSNAMAIVYADSGNSAYGTSVVVDVGGVDRPLTSDNYIGIAATGAPSGQGAKINIKGAVADIPAAYYDIANASYDDVSFDVSGQDTNPRTLAFNNSGTKMYIVGRTNDTVYQYSLSTAFNVGTASYDSVSFSVASQDNDPLCISFNNDGTKFYIVGNQTDTIYQYSLSSAFDMSTASYDSVSFSVSSQDAFPDGMAFNNDGSKVYVVGDGTDTVYQYSLSTEFDLSTASYDSVSFDASGQDSSGRSVAFNSDGTKMFITGATTDTVYQYSLSTAFNVGTASYDSVSFSFASQDSAPFEMVFTPDGTKMYIVGNTTDTVYQYSTSVSLTAGQSYYVQTDGTLGTTPADPSVFAGTAVAATKLIVKG